MRVLGFLFGIALRVNLLDFHFLFSLRDLFGWNCMMTDLWLWKLFLGLCGRPFLRFISLLLITDGLMLDAHSLFFYGGYDVTCSN